MTRIIGKDGKSTRIMGTDVCPVSITGPNVDNTFNHAI